MLFQVKIYILTKNIPAVKKSEPEKVLVTTIPWCETNIPIEESIQIILDFIEIQNNPTYPPLCILKQLLIFVLNYNVFNFGNLLFLQSPWEQSSLQIMPICLWLILKVNMYSLIFHSHHFTGDVLMTFS